MRRHHRAAVGFVCGIWLATGCVVGEGDITGDREGGDDTIAPANNPSVQNGRDIWFNSTFGGEKFFVFLANHPDPETRIDVGFEEVALTPRAQRFEIWGVINDPDCEANPDGGFDICDDPTDSGVVGIRKLPGPDGPNFGVACAGCHAGFDPLDPPDNPAEPTWDNIHPSIGNQYLDIGKIFAANLAADDPRRIMFDAWPNGTVDTTLLFSDDIMNPGVMTAFWEHKHRPTFDVGMEEEKLRNGQGGEDDVGGDLAALRVYTNIGVCFQECVAPAVQGDRPISIQECRDRCDDFPTQGQMDDLSAFLGSIPAPRYPHNGDRIDDVYDRGEQVFADNCASCHDDSEGTERSLTNDEVIPLWKDPNNTTNRCRALTSNWEEGNLWAEFSSQVYKDRVAAGNRGYRVMPLTGIWSTAPFLHNQSIGPWAPADASPRERAEAYEAAMRELLQAEREPLVYRLPVDVGPFEAGTPLTYVFSRDPDTGELLCDDGVENRGHHYGADLPDSDKEALIHWLKFQ